MKMMNRLIPIYLLIFMLFVNPFSWSRVSALQTQTISTEKFGQSPEVRLQAGSQSLCMKDSRVSKGRRSSLPLRVASSL